MTVMVKNSKRRIVCSQEYIVEFAGKIQHKPESYSSTIGLLYVQSLRNKHSNLALVIKEKKNNL